MAMIAKSFKNFISCDWGTTNLRLRLVDAQSAAILGLVSSSKGIAQVYNEWSGSHTTREEYFGSVLRDGIGELARKTNTDTMLMPVIISGMASSTLGIAELAYAPLPFSADGSSVTFKVLSPASVPGRIFLISGVRSDEDVMRGEETQWTGIHQLETVSELSAYTLILPGTHSKHMQVSAGTMIAFSTYMTGEFFNLLSAHSVLKNSVDLQTSDPDDDQLSFLEGVRAAKKNDLLHQSFMVRTNHLFGRFSKSQNSQYLSGLLIGSELVQLKGDTVVLAAGLALYHRYEIALRELHPGLRLISITPAELDTAVIKGQLTIFNQNKGWE